MKAAKQNRSKRNRADRKNMIRENKKKAWIAAGVAVLLLAAGATRLGLTATAKIAEEARK